ncbi:unnamed protein product [Urochloa humidicola]
MNSWSEPCSTLSIYVALHNLHRCTRKLMRQLTVSLSGGSVSVHIKYGAPRPCQSAPGLRLPSIITYQASPQIALST